MKNKVPSKREVERLIYELSLQDAQQRDKERERKRKEEEEKEKEARIRKFEWLQAQSGIPTEENRQEITKPQTIFSVLIETLRKGR